MRTKNISKHLIFILILFAFVSCKQQGLFTQKKYNYLKKVPVNSEVAEISKPEKIKNKKPKEILNNTFIFNKTEEEKLYIYRCVRDEIAEYIRQLPELLYKTSLKDFK